LEYQREEHRSRVFENRVLRRIFGPKMKWQEKTVFEKLYTLHASSNVTRMSKSRRKGWAGHLACMG
jgi:hypothetical protein